MVTPRSALVAVALAAAGCESFEDPDVVIDLRVLAMTATPPDQMITVDLAQPINPAELIEQLVPVEVCALVADPEPRRLAWSMQMCLIDDRCELTDGPVIALGSGVVDDPDTAVPAPRICVTIDPNGSGLPALLFAALEDDDLGGLGGVDFMVQLQVGGETDDRALDQYAAKTLRVLPRIPETRTANTNPDLLRFDTSSGGSEPVPLPLGRCVDTPAPLAIAAGDRLRLDPIETATAREVYVAPTLDGKTLELTEALTYQWIASAGGFSSGNTGGTRDVSGNPPPLFSEFRAPDAEELDGPTDVSLWIVQRDERLGSHWYEACVRVVP